MIPVARGPGLSTEGGPGEQDWAFWAVLNLRDAAGAALEVCKSNEPPSIPVSAVNLD